MREPPKTLVASVLTVAIAVVTLAPGTAIANPLEAPSVTPTLVPAVGEDAWKLLRATNDSRERFDLPPLLLDFELSALARRHSLVMARIGSLFHTPDVGIYLRTIDWHTWGENVGYTPGDIGSLHHAFMASPTHRENILNGAFRHVAIGSVRVDGTLWMTVFFYG